MSAAIKLSDEARCALRADLAQIGDEALAVRLVDYLERGDDEAALRNLRNVDEAGRKLELVGAGYHYFQQARPREAAIALLPGDAPELWLRLGRIYEAAVAPEKRHLYLRHTFDDTAQWVELLLLEITALTDYGEGHVRTPPPSAAVLEATLELAGLSPDLMARAVYAHDPEEYVNVWRGIWSCMDVAPMFLALDGFAGSLGRHPQALADAQGDRKGRLISLSVLARAGADVAPLADVLVAAAVGSAKTAHRPATALLATAPQAARPALLQKAAGKNAAERLRAVEVLSEIGPADEALRAFFAERTSSERSKKTQQAIEVALAKLGAPASDGAAAAAAAAPTTAAAPAAADDTLAALRLPPLPAELDSDPPLAEDVARALDALVDDYNAQVARHQIGDPFDAAKRTRLHEQIASLRAAAVAPWELASFEALMPVDIRRSSDVVIEAAGLSLVQLARLLLLAGRLGLRGTPAKDGRYAVFNPHTATLGRALRRYNRAHDRAFGLRELAAAFDRVGIDAALFGDDVLDDFYEDGEPAGLAPELVWPYFAERLELLEEVFQISGGQPSRKPLDSWRQRYRRRNAMRVLRGFPALPAALRDVLWQVALGSAKQERPFAQRCLERDPERIARIAANLGSGKQDERAVAARWLGQLGDAAATSELEAALAKEKRDVARGAMMEALERLGVPLERFFSRETMIAEATKALAKNKPRHDDIAFFDLDGVALRWRNSGEPVVPALREHLLRRAHKLKDPAPDPLLRRAASLWDDEGRAALAAAVLGQWVAADTASDDTSAIGAKGVLALVGAAGAAAEVDVIRGYLDKHYGWRPAQCKALLSAITWMDDPSAAQLLLRIARRFRTYGIQRHAEAMVEDLVERRGWTREELADRTVPDGGFGADGVRTLKSGERTFTLRLGAEGAIAIEDPDGRTLKSLPAARKADDPLQVKKAKQTLTRIKKQVTDALRSQRERLYEAMCTQRAWSAADFDRYLRGHPLVGPLCQRLIFAAYHVAPDGRQSHATLFRPLADGTLSDADDETVTLAPQSVVRVAHGTTVDSAACAAWLSHLDDYDVAPLFDQLGREPYRLPADAVGSEQLDEFVGFAIESFALREQALARGFSLGEVGDGGVLYSFRKSFPSLSLEATLTFSGVQLPMERTNVALGPLGFERVTKDEEDNRRSQSVGLDELPVALLSECYHDVREIAAAGSGLDPRFAD
ncbi:MAG: DUF4132 domain-containing protein [Myxococcales bacterium]|nr:DUF4132 domain-containing protein [Myxococcales bacterium]